MAVRTLTLAMMGLSLVLSASPACADMTGDPDFCYVGWVRMPRYAYGEDERGVLQVRLTGTILVCPTDPG